MSMKYGMFDALNIGTEDAPVWDRAVDSEFFARFFSTVCNSGITFGSFSVSPKEGLAVEVSPGSAVIEGRVCYDDSATTLVIPSVSASRSDLVVVRLDYTSRSLSLAVASGQNEPTRNGNMYELAVARIDLPAAATSITSDMITDLRSDPSLCGVAGAIVSGLPTITTGAAEPANPSKGDIWLVTE